MVEGDAFAIDIRMLFADAHPKLHGKFGVVWCVGPAGKDWRGVSLSRFALADLLLDAQPSLADLQRRELSTLTFSFSTKPEPGVMVLEDGPLPRGVVHLGLLPTLPALMPEEASHEVRASWSNFAVSWHYQWRHDHEQVEIKAEADRSLAKENAKREAAAKKRRAGGLAGLARRKLLPEWNALVSKTRSDAVRAILRDALVALKAVDSAPKKMKLSELEKAVAQINAYNDKQGCFIETPEREALTACLLDIAAVCDLGAVDAQLDEWRDW